MGYLTIIIIPWGIHFVADLTAFFLIIARFESVI